MQCPFYFGENDTSTLLYCSMAWAVILFSTVEPSA